MKKVEDGYIVTDNEMVELMMGVMDRIERLDERRQYVEDRFHDNWWEEAYQKCDAIYTAFYGHSYKESKKNEQSAD